MKKEKGKMLTGSVINVAVDAQPRLRRREPVQGVHVVLAEEVGDLGGGPEVVVRDHAHQDPHLVQPQTFPVAPEPVRERVDAQAVVRRREGGDVAGEEGRTDDDVGLRRLKHGEVGRRLGAGLAIVIRVSRVVV